MPLTRVITEHNLTNIVIYETKEIYNSPAGDMRGLLRCPSRSLVWQIFIHSHWGVEYEYYFPDGDHHHRPKPKRPSKHKKYKPKKNTQAPSP